MKFLLLALSISISITAQARWLTKDESGTVVEKFDVQYHVHKDGTSDQDIEYVLRVQSEDAKVNSSLFTIEYNAMTDKVDILEAYTLNGKKKFNVEPSAIEDRDKGESRDYDVQKVRSILYPQVQVGSHLHIRYRVKTTKPSMKDEWSNVNQFTPGLYVEKMRVRIDSELPLYYEVRDPRGLLRVRQPSAKRIEFSNRKDLPGWVQGEKDPYFHPAGFSEVWVSTGKVWKDFFADISSQYEAIENAPLPDDLKPWVKKAERLKTTEDKILFLMEKMSREFRYFGDWRRHDGAYIPRTLAEINKSRYGDCKDLASVLSALLRGLKMDAHVALVRRGENPWGVEPDYKLPASGRFNHAIVQAKADGQTYWLDATNPVTALKPFPDISGRPAFVLKPGGGEFERLPEAKPEEFVHIHNYEYRFKNEDTVLVDVDARLEKLAPYHFANQLMLAPRSEVLTETLDYFSEGQEIHKFHYNHEPKTSRALHDMKIGLEYEAGRVTFNAGKSSFWVIPDGFLDGAFYETADRESDLKLADAPYSLRSVRRLKQTRLAQEVPAPCRVQSDWMDLEREVKVDGNDVVITNSVLLKKPFIERSVFRTGAFRKLQGETKHCFHRAGLLIESANRALSSSVE